MFGKNNISHIKMDATTYIAEGMRIEGKVQCVGPIRIDGEVNGDIECRNEISIGPSAFIEATIHADRILVNGKVQGNLFASDQLEVLSEGHILGNVSTPSGQLIIHEGGVIEGQCITFDVPDETIVQEQIDVPKSQLNAHSKDKKVAKVAASSLPNGIVVETGR